MRRLDRNDALAILGAGLIIAGLASFDYGLSAIALGAGVLFVAVRGR